MPRLSVTTVKGCFPINVYLAGPRVLDLARIPNLLSPHLIKSVEKTGSHGRPTIVLVTSSLEGGGAERVLSDMANYWTNQGWQVSFATWSGPNSADFYVVDPEVKRIWLDVPARNTSSITKLTSNLRRVGKLRAILRDSEADVVLSFIDWSNVLTILAAIGLPTRVVVSERVHAAHPRLAWPWRILRTIIYARANAVVAQTDDAAQWLERHCRSATITIPNPLRDLPVSSVQKKPYILSVGRLCYQKGFDVLLRAFANIYHDYEEWELIIVGAGPEQGSLNCLRDELGLARKVRIIEPVKDVETLMSCAGLVVQPSRFEGFPNVVLEAMGMGAPVISADCPSGPSEIIVDGVNGRLVPVDDVVALSIAMAECISRPELRDRLGQKATEVRQRYRQDIIMAQWESCLYPQGHRAISSETAAEETRLER